MATSLVSSLPTIHPIYDPLTASLQDAADPASGREGQSQVEVQLEIEDVLDSDEWRLIGEFLNPYDYTTDEAQVSLHKALQGAFNASPALILEGSMTEIPDIVKRYRLKARDVVDGEPVGEFATLTPAYAWHAGRRGNFQTWDPLSGKGYIFLTRMPSTRRIAPKEILTFQFMALESVVGVKLEVTNTYANGTTEVFESSLGDITQYHTYAYDSVSPSGYATQPVKMVIKLIGAFSGTQPTITYNVTSNPSPWSELIFLRNSFGGWDQLYCTGKNQKILNFTSELFEAQEFPIQAGQMGNSRAFNQRGVEGYTFRTGFLSENEQRGVADLLLRNDAWHYYNTELWPMIITTRSIIEKEDGEFLYAAEITAQYAFEHLAY